MKREELDVFITHQATYWQSSFIEETLGLAQGVGFETFDEYTNITRNDEKARLDNYGIELQTDPTSMAYVVVYPGSNGRAGEVQLRSARVVDYLDVPHL